MIFYSREIIWAERFVWEPSGSRPEGVGSELFSAPNFLAAARVILWVMAWKCLWDNRRKLEFSDMYEMENLESLIYLRYLTWALEPRLINLVVVFLYCMNWMYEQLPWLQGISTDFYVTKYNSKTPSGSNELSAI